MPKPTELENVAADTLRSKITAKDKANHQPRNLVIYDSSSVLVPIRNKRQRFLIPLLSCLVFIFRPTFEIHKVLLELLFLSILHRKSPQRRDKMDKSYTFLLDPNILKRSETYYQHKHKFVSTSLEIGPAFNSDQT